MSDLTQGLAHGWPDSEWVLDGETYEGLIWLSNTARPSLPEIEAAAEAAAQAAADKEAADAAARDAAIAHAKSLGFTDEMIAVMYPSLGVANA